MITTGYGVGRQEGWVACSGLSQLFMGVGSGSTSHFCTTFQLLFSHSIAMTPLSLLM
jgi:hypothetical protein